MATKSPGQRTREPAPGVPQDGMLRLAVNPRRGPLDPWSDACLDAGVLGYHAAPMTSRHETIDCHRLLCPMPVIRVQDRVETLAAGDTLTAVCTDPGALQDIPAWCRINGHAVVAVETRGVEYLVTLRVGNGRP